MGVYVTLVGVQIRRFAGPVLGRSSATGYLSRRHLSVPGAYPAGGGYGSVSSIDGVQLLPLGANTYLRLPKLRDLILYESPESLGFYFITCPNLALIGELSRVSLLGQADG